MIPPREEFKFFRVWCRLAKHGMCDRAHGAEYQRILREWAAVGAPRPIRHFICFGANYPEKAWVQACPN